MVYFATHLSRRVATLNPKLNTNVLVEPFPSVAAECRV